MKNPSNYKTINSAIWNHNNDKDRKDHTEQGKEQKGSLKDHKSFYKCGELIVAGGEIWDMFSRSV